MPDIPAICNSCGTLFPSGMFLENCRDMSLSGCTAGPCPRCGSQGHIPDGIYNVTGNIIELLSGPGSTIEALTRLKEKLTRIRDRTSNQNEIRSQVEEVLSEHEGLKNYIPKNGSELAAYIAVIVSIIALILNYGFKNKDKIGPDNVINQINIDQTINIQASTERVIPKVGRTEPCPCGSGLKYKKCHGK